ncbi:pectinesterase-like [Cucurbita pepo subsp. pepo]|uniref:pectinesterase-like n=1 Tax=Cucurbita pepo subsp. pepo TaxID=3664 RepID=UPI000C9D4E0E|nr:pectinesterase-like [Cucurbita pepo subsp. pepo]
MHNRTSLSILVFKYVVGEVILITSSFTASTGDLFMATHEPLLPQPPKTTRPKTFFTILFFSLLLCSAIFITNKLINSDPSENGHHPFLHNICNMAYNQSSCIQMLASEFPLLQETKTTNAANFLQSFLRKSTSKIVNTIENAKDLRRRINNPRGEAALADCVELMEISMDRITDSILALKSRRCGTIENAHTWLSSVLTNHVTYSEGIENSISKTAAMDLGVEELIVRGRNSLGMLVSIWGSGKEEMGYPSWLKKGDRRLLEVVGRGMKADIVVAKDGSGNFKTVKEAVEAVPDKSKNRIVIYVKKGIYKENVEVGKNKKNVMLVGDGMDSTIITASLNVVDGSTTFRSATVAAVGDGFIAQDIWFRNTAGPEKHQAVALRVGADQSVINRCRIDAYQDTLYAHTNRQFYRDSTITGTVDFIFGNAAVVLQNCKIEPRRPMSNQANMVTAQGRTDPNQNTGTSIQKCQIVASSDLEPVKKSIKTYLGRPWKEYSRTVVMQSTLGDLIDPAGWAEWNGDFALKTLYYGEYSNNGPGSNVSKRVKWPGYHVITSPAVAQKFTVDSLIQGAEWLGSSGVTFIPGL